MPPRANAALHDATLLAICKAAADARRLEILRVLSVDSYAVLELAHLFDMPQPGISHHLKILSGAGLLVARREGNSIYYRRALVPPDHDLAPLWRELYAAVDGLALPAAVARRIAEIHRQRATHSREFFRRNAGRFRQNQELIAHLAQYLPQVEDLLRHARVPPASTIMEVGPGEGELLLHLAQRYARVIALDNSPEMLARAREAASREALANVHFVEGEIPRAIGEDLEVDLMVLNMVLHHMAAPSHVFQQGRQLVRAKGALLIIDLCAHDQDWVRESCGDVWLGFEPEELELWASHAGFAREQSTYLALRNGFQVQMQLFHPATGTTAGDPEPTPRTLPAAS